MRVRVRVKISGRRSSGRRRAKHSISVEVQYTLGFAQGVPVGYLCRRAGRVMSVWMRRALAEELNPSDDEVATSCMPHSDDEVVPGMNHPHASPWSCQHASPWSCPLSWPVGYGDGSRWSWGEGWFMLCSTAV